MIQRYDMWDDDNGSYMDEAYDGGYVRYEDHMNIVKELHAGIESLQAEIYHLSK